MKSLETLANPNFKQVCNICQHKDSSHYYDVLFRCNYCGFVWADINLSGEDLSKIYEKNYFFGEEYIDYLAEESILKFNFKIFENKIKKLFIEKTIRPKLLEIGSAYGFFLEIARKNFDVAGVEISSDAVNFSRNNGHLIYQGDFSNIVLNDQYDVIVSFATLEHIVSPEKIFQQAFNYLKPGGYFYITTIDIGSLFARLWGKNWRMIHPPTHVSYFSSSTIKLLLENNGFQLLESKSIWQYRSLIALFPPEFSGSLLYKILVFLRLSKIPIPFNFGDVIGILAKKMQV